MVELVEHPSDLECLNLDRRVAVVCQTTQRYEALQELVDALLPRVAELAVSKTICDATTQRQEAALRMARQVDVVIVVGGRHSANTTRLAHICRDAGKPTWHVETAAEIDCAWVRDAGRVGVTAGASTPDGAIEATVRRLQECAEE